jgi:hypothetical protein
MNDVITIVICQHPRTRLFVYPGWQSQQSKLLPMTHSWRFATQPLIVDGTRFASLPKRVLQHTLGQLIYGIVFGIAWVPPKQTTI